LRHPETDVGELFFIAEHYFEFQFTTTAICQELSNGSLANVYQLGSMFIYYHSLLCYLDIQACEVAGNLGLEYIKPLRPDCIKG
jgi:hypothetical protein